MVCIIKISRMRKENTSNNEKKWPNTHNELRLTWVEERLTGARELLYAWISKLKLTVNSLEWIRTREPCVLSTRRSIGRCRIFFGLQFRRSILHTSRAHADATHLGMLRRLIWSIMHKSTCFNFAWKNTTASKYWRPNWSSVLRMFAY